MSEHRLIEFDFNNLLNIDSFILCCIGSSGSGKTTILKYILDISKDNFTHVFLYQGSLPSEDNVYTEFIWPSDIVIVDHLEDKQKRENIIKNIQDYNNKVTIYNNCINDLNKTNKTNNEKIKPIKTLFIFDDFGPNSKHFSSLSNVARHSLSSYIYLVHNDTDLDPPLRKKITHYFINVSFKPNQIMDMFKDVKPKYEEYRSQFIINNNKKCFLVLEKDNIETIKYCNLNINQIEMIGNNSLFYRTSRQRKQIVKIFKELVIEINNPINNTIV